MMQLTEDQITLLILYGVPRKAAKIVSEYFPKDDECFCKNFGQSSPYSSNDPRRFFYKVFEIMDKYLDIHLDFASFGTGDAEIVNPDIEFEIVEDLEFNPGKIYLAGGYGKYTKCFGCSGVVKNGIRY